jgi:hypothetical protein
MSSAVDNTVVGNGLVLGKKLYFDWMILNDGYS